MAKKDVLEIRITFRQDQLDLYEYIKNHNSSAGFLKDLAQREMLKDENYIKHSLNNETCIAQTIPYYMPQQMINVPQYYIPQQTVLNNTQSQMQQPSIKAPVQDNNIKNEPELDFSIDDVNVLQRLLENKEK